MFNKIAKFLVKIYCKFLGVIKKGKAQSTKKKLFLSSKRVKYLDEIVSLFLKIMMFLSAFSTIVKH